MKRSTILGAIALLWAAAAPAAAQTTVSTDITTSTTWTTSGSPYEVTTNIRVLSGATLTIEPGVVVKMGAGRSLLIEGTLIADGTDIDRITFTSAAGTPAAGDWNAVEFRNTSNTGSVFDHVLIEYGGGPSRDAMLYYTTGAFAVAVTNSEFRFSAKHGLNLRASNVLVEDSHFHDNVGFGVFSDLSLNYTVRDNVFEDNAEGGIRVPVNAAPTIMGNTITGSVLGVFVDNGGTPSITGNTIQGNQIGIRFRDIGGSQPNIQGNTISGNSQLGFQMVGINGTVRVRFNYWGSNLGPYHPSLNPTGAGDPVSDRVDFIPWTTTSGTLPIKNVAGSLSGVRTWSADTVYVVTASVTIPNGSSLTLEPGTIVKFATGQSMTISGLMSAIGTPDAYVVFTSLRDDTFGGDSNGDGEATVPAPGNWSNLFISSPGASVGSTLRYAVVRFGSNQALYLNGRLSDDRLSHVFATNHSGAGVLHANNRPLTVHRSVIGANSGYGLHHSNSSNAPLVIDSSAVDGNGTNGIFGSGNFVLTIKNSQFRQNGTHGFHWVNGKLDTLMNSVFEFNSQVGAFLDNANSPHHIVGNSFSQNGAQGFALFNNNAEFHQIRIENNTFNNNGAEGLLSSRALVLNNTFHQNQYALGTWYRVGLRFKEGAGNDTNSLTANAANNIVTLRSSSISDTLANRFPLAVTSKSYLVLTSPNLSTNATLVIEPGVNLKFGSGQSLGMNGNNARIIAMGTEENPITFTSYRDNSAGGKTHAASDTTTARRGDWYGISINNSPNSRFDHAHFRFAGRAMDVNNTVANMPYRNLEIREMTSFGVVAPSSTFRLEDSHIRGIGSYGIYAHSSSDVTVRTSVFEYNGTALYAGSSAAFREVSNSEIRFNGTGVQVDGGTIPQTYSGNLIQHNSSHGIVNNSTVSLTNLTYVGNQVLDNGGEGILTSRSTFIDNTFARNRHGIGYWNRLGYKFTDNNGVDGNIFNANVYNQALALHAFDLRDTLTTNMPVAISQPVYHVMNHGGTTVSTNAQFTVNPGVHIKFFPGQFLAVQGTLYAVGTDADPITFTSYRDHSAGGKTNLAADTVSAKAGDWGYIYLNNNNARNSRIAHARLAFGQSAIRFYNVTDSVYSNLHIHDHSVWGIEVYNRLILEDSRIVRSGNFAIYAPAAESDVTVRRTEIAHHSNHGLYSNTATGGFREISESHIHHNTTGIHQDFTTIPSSYVFNTIELNRAHGIWHNAKNDAADTLLIVGNSLIRNNAVAGLVTSRAYVTNDSIYGNAFSIGHTGQLSKGGTINENGNYYLDNVIEGNTFGDIHYLDGALAGILGGTYSIDTERPVYYTPNALRVNSADSLIVRAGSILKFNGGHLQSDGRISVRGTANRKVVFTSWRDDTYGGDSNQDSTNTAPAPGNWTYLYLNGTQNNQSTIRHAIVRYASYGFFTQNNTAQVDSSAFSNSTYGMYIISGSPVIRGNDIHSSSIGIYASGYGGGTVINLNNIWNNGDGLHNASNLTLNAINNFWGSETGPLVNNGPDLNPGGQGNRINVATGIVNYRPFLVARTGIQIGDVTQNGTISAYDGSIVLQSLVDLVTLTPAQQAAADVTGDGTISAVDASYILQYVVGRITGFPGLGKIPASDLASAFRYDAVEAGGVVDVRIKLESQIGILGTELHLAYPAELISGVEVLAAEASAEWSTQRNDRDGVLKLAYAGTVAVNDGDLIHLRFTLNDGVSGVARLLQPQRFKLNETDLTEALGAEVTSIGDETRALEFALEPNFPNPFNPTTQIGFSLAEAGRVRLTVYDVLGREVAVLLDDNRPAGRFQVSFDASGFNSGMYLYRLQSGNQVRTGKMTLLK